MTNHVKLVLLPSLWMDVKPTRKDIESIVFLLLSISQCLIVFRLGPNALVFPPVSKMVGVGGVGGLVLVVVVFSLALITSKQRLPVVSSKATFYPHTAVLLICYLVLYVNSQACHQLSFLNSSYYKDRKSWKRVLVYGIRGKYLEVIQYTASEN